MKVAHGLVLAAMLSVARVHAIDFTASSLASEDAGKIQTAEKVDMGAETSTLTDTSDTPPDQSTGDTDASCSKDFELAPETSEIPETPETPKTPEAPEIPDVEGLVPSDESCSKEFDVAGSDDCEQELDIADVEDCSQGLDIADEDCDDGLDIAGADDCSEGLDIAGDEATSDVSSETSAGATPDASTPDISTPDISIPETSTTDTDTSTTDTTDTTDASTIDTSTDTGTPPTETETPPDVTEEEPVNPGKSKKGASMNPFYLKKSAWSTTARELTSINLIIS